MAFNPAWELHEALVAINSNNAVVNEQLRSIAAEGEDIRDVSTRLLTLLAQTESICRSTGRWERNSALFTQLWESLMITEVAWSNNVINVGEAWMISLANLADAFDSLDFLPKPLTPEQLDALRVALEKMRDILTTHTEVPHQLRSYLLYLTKRALDLLHGENVDLLALRSISFEIIGSSLSLSLCAVEVLHEFRDHLAQLFDTWIRPMLTGAGGNLIASGTGSAITLLIEAATKTN